LLQFTKIPTLEEQKELKSAEQSISYLINAYYALLILSFTVKVSVKNIRTSITIDPSFKIDPVIIANGRFSDFAKEVML
jgi:hypothetical protein